MRNLDELYLENKEKKTNETNRKKNLLVERLARDIKNLTTNKDFMKEAEEMLIEDGCFKICHSGVIIDDKIYIIAGKGYLNISDKILANHANYQQLEAASQQVQELIGKEFIDFWAGYGVCVVFYFNNIFFVVNSLWDKINNQFEKDLEQIKGSHTALYFPGDRLGRISERLDILKYVSGPFCYIE